MMKWLVPSLSIAAIVVGCTLNTRGELAESQWQDASVKGGSGGVGDAASDDAKPPWLLDGGKDAAGAAGKGGGSQGGAGGGSQGGAGGAGGVGGQGGYSGCPGECTPGESGSLTCGSGCETGEQQVQCDNACKWAGAGGCVVTTECQTEGASETQQCNCGGQRSRTCEGCVWTPWSSCSKPTQCSAGEWLCAGCPQPNQGKACEGQCWSTTCTDSSGQCGGTAGAGGGPACGLQGAACTQQAQCCPDYYCNTHNSANQCMHCLANGTQCWNKVQCCSNQCSGTPGSCY